MKRPSHPSSRQPVPPAGDAPGAQRDRNPRANRAVDLRALSQHLGLSKGTISRALNGYPEIAERTRLRVLQAAEELGYRPNRAARRLATGRNDLISYIGVGSDWMAVDRAFLGALSSTLGARGYGLMVSLADTMAHAEDAMEQLLEDKRVDGFIFNGAFPMDGRVRLALERQVPAVIVGAFDADGGALKTAMGAVPTIGLSDAAVLDGLVDYMVSLGHRSFAYFGCDAPTALQRRHADTLEASTGNRETAFARSTRADVEDTSDDGARLLQAESAASLTDRAAALLAGRPTAVFCGCERTVVALYVAARDMGLHVPRELSIIGIGPSQLASWLSGGLSTVSWSLGEAGRLGADCVVAQIEGTALPQIASGIEATFLARASHGPAPRS